MVWALLATTGGGVEPEQARFLRDAAHEGGGEEDPYTTEEPASTTLAAYAHAGLDAWVHFLYYHRALSDLPVIPFVVVPGDGGGEDGADDGEG